MFARKSLLIKLFCRWHLPESEMKII